ncbi:TIGR00730 family Rossman fold protein [Microbacteriaceae bacterium VKM Ac-2855]|nr:TIGR00730 family Rossman fold protein [Microbacteriaceae bacterium VKM Ac-2855]
MTSRFTVAVFCGSSPGNDPQYVAAATAVGGSLAERGMGVVYGGGDVGLMGAVADGALAAGGHVTGVIPRALHQRERMNDRVSELIVVDTMHERKTIMAERSDAFIALPGGPGTLEEITEQWTWAQLGIHAKPCGFFNIDGYFDPLFAFIGNMRDRGFTHPRYTDMLIADDDLDRLLDAILGYVAPTPAVRSPGQEMDDASRLRP